MRKWTTLYWKKECFIALFYMTGFYFLDRCCLPIISHYCCSYEYSLLLIVYCFSLAACCIHLFFKEKNNKKEWKEEEEEGREGKTCGKTNLMSFIICWIWRVSNMLDVVTILKGFLLYLKILKKLSEKLLKKICKI